ncbi:MAG: glycoside hydrolase family 3 C-terminal domain-containing protein [Butyrivibrio sp.]|nr:glycoside hydrolase family 3 C-terminal domain-containing protein [Butyrivibrio sp.]
MQKWARLNYQPGLSLYGGLRVTGSEEHIKLSEDAAKEGMVLLKNDGVLPLKKESPVVMLGKASVDYVKGGGGSGDVHCEYIHSLYDGLKSRGVEIFEPVIDFYSENIKEQYSKNRVPGMTSEPIPSEALLKEASAFSDIALVSFCRFSGEGWDRSSIEHDVEFSPWPRNVSMPQISGEIFPEGDFYLSENEKEIVRLAKEHFKKVVIILNIGGIIDCSFIENDDAINAAFYMGQGGMRGGDAAASILLGETSPSGRLADTFAGSLLDYPSTEGYHESFEYVDYSEDIYVGYRYFETIPGADKKVIYPFGFGLSYTDFDIELTETKKLEGKELPDIAGTGFGGFKFKVKVTNTGKARGKEVVQLYYGAPAGKLGKAKKALGAFAKTKELAPGESQELELFVTLYEMASFDDLGKVKEASYVLEPGTYEFFLGENVRDAAKISFTWECNEAIIAKELSHNLTPVELEKRMLSDGSFEKLSLGEHKDKDACIFEKMEPGTEEALSPINRHRDRYYITRPYKEGAKPFMEVAEGKISLDDFMAQLSDDELLELLGGQVNTGVANVFGFGNLPEYGVPNAMTSDGPAGVRIAPETGVLTTAFPCSTLIACTWNTEIAEAVGFAGGEELKENNMCVWLTPAVNIHRNPMCGRNFEYYSEDPYLTGKMAAAMVRGIQKNNVGASVKHFACNNKETNRKHCDSRVSERALREIYLKGFEIIVNESEPYTIMSSYNVINGERASESHDLLTGILRDEWGFKGMVTSDWWTRGEHYKEILAGNDLKMATGFPERVKKAMEMGAISRKELEICARRILATLLKFD